MVDALRHAVMQTLDQFLDVAAELSFSFSILRLKKDTAFTKIKSDLEASWRMICRFPDLDEKPARHLHSGDVSEASAAADGHGVGGPGGGEVQPESRKTQRCSSQTLFLFQGNIYLKVPL